MAPPITQPPAIKKEQNSEAQSSTHSVKLEQPIPTAPTTGNNPPDPDVDLTVNGVVVGDAEVNGKLNAKVKTPPKDIPLFLPPILQQAAKAVAISSHRPLDTNGNAAGDGAKVKRRIIAPGKEEIALRTKPVDERVARKQRRLIRNRVSAQLHRERKKKHVTELEIRVADLTSQNSSLQKKVATLTSANEDLKKQLETCTEKLRKLEDLRFMVDGSKQAQTPIEEPSPRSASEIQLLPDVESSYEMLDSPSSLDVDWDSSLEEDDVSAVFDSPDEPEPLTDSFGRFSDTSDASSVMERPKKLRRHGSSKALSAACLAALVFTVSVIGDSMRQYPDDTVYTSNRRSLLQVSPDAVRRSPVVIDSSRRLLAKAEGSNGEANRGVADDVNSSMLVRRIGQSERQQHAVLMQLALRKSSELLVNQTKNATSELKSAISNELDTLTGLFKEKPRPALSNEHKNRQTRQSDSKSLVLRTERKEEPRLDAVRAALNAYITHIGGSVRAEDLLQSYIMCPSAYGVLDTGRNGRRSSGVHQARARRQGKKSEKTKSTSKSNPRVERRERRQMQNRTDLTLIVPSRSLYGARQDGIVQLHCQVQRVTEFFVGYS